MQKLSIAFLALIAWPVHGAKAEMSAMDEAKTMINMRGAPCGAVTGAERDPSRGNVVAQCSNGMIYGVGRTADGKGLFLMQRNSLTGKFERYSK